MEPNFDPATPEIALAENKSAATSSTSIAKEQIEAASSLSLSTKFLHQGLGFKQLPAIETTTMTKCWHLDVITEILIRLPVSSIIKCMCVCKQWKSFITSHEFISLHQSHKLNTTPPNILIRHGSWYSNADCFNVYCDDESSCLMQTFSSPFNLEKRKYHNIDLVGAIRGLICLAMTNNFDSFLWNPSIKRYLKLPKLDVSSRTEDTCDTYRVMGFGFDSLRNDYKVLKIFFVRRRCGTNCLWVKIYTLKEQSWRELDPNKVRPYVIESWASSYFSNGSVHWIAQEQTNNLARTCILSFDTNYECFNWIELPSDLLEVRLVRLCISETKDLLSIFHGDESHKFCDIWVKKEYRDNLWTKIYNINFDFVDQFLVRVFKLRENGEILVMKSNHSPIYGIYALASYDPIIQEIKAFGTDMYSYPEYGGTHIESLLLLNGCNGMVSYVEPQIESADWEFKSHIKDNDTDSYEDEDNDNYMEESDSDG